MLEPNDDYDHYYDEEVWDLSRDLFDNAPFNAATPDSQALKTLHEAQEFQENPSLEEAADILVCLAGWLIKSNYTWDDLVDAWGEKTIVNINRKWIRQEDGTFQHE